jgi:hypothetical protein
MKKILFTLAVLGTAVLGSFAQTTKSSSSSSKFSIGFDAAVPSGTASNLYNAGVGGSLKYEASIASNVLITFSAGYEAFLTKSEFKNLGVKSSFGFVPLKAGVKYYFDQGFFGEAQLGASISTESGGGTAFAYSPGIGYSFDGGFELGARYEAWSKNGTFGQFALRLAYRF